ncbi:hypothetical protein A9W98_34080 [Mycobacterium gordonae]|uniref:Uncharacterized protein n=1 Tax=Mycobacterium gordonae TaxID=1778 RepID=A0A1A6B8V1_MYCGO|nr:hypothetical protein A9W98_34080 [Mycobacterium gordonae]
MLESGDEMLCVADRAVENQIWAVVHHALVIRTAHHIDNSVQRRQRWNRPRLRKSQVPDRDSFVLVLAEYPRCDNPQVLVRH